MTLDKTTSPYNINIKDPLEFKLMPLFELDTTYICVYYLEINTKLLNCLFKKIVILRYNSMI